MDRLIYTAASGARALMQRQDGLANNLANANTPGFRADEVAFRAVPVRGEGATTRVASIEASAGFDDRTGPITGTGRDLLVLLLIYAQLLLGMASLVVSTGHMDGEQMAKFAKWAQHIVTFRSGAAEFIVGAHWIYQAHLVLGLVLILITPFTRLVHIWSVPLGYLRRPYQVVRKRQASLQYPGR
mgnify:CR=1 FL=1